MVVAHMVKIPIFMFKANIFCTGDFFRNSTGWLIKIKVKLISLFYRKHLFKRKLILNSFFACVNEDVPRKHI